MQHLYFVRHGLSVMNILGKFSGRTDTPLAPEGIEQSKVAGQQASSLGIDLIVTSPMERALETAKIMAQQMGYDQSKIVINDLFMEREFGLLEGTLYSKTRDVEGFDGVETVAQILDRAQKGIDFLNRQQANTILVVSHGATGRALRTLLNPKVPFDYPAGFGNAVIVKLL